MIVKEVRNELGYRISDRAERQGLTDEAEIDGLILDTVVEYSKEHYLSLADKRTAVRMLTATVRGLDVLSELITDGSISEIMVNGENDIFIERDGRIEKYDIPFTSRQKLEDAVQKIAAQSNRRINEADPIADARLPDGSRVSLVLPPVSLNGPVITIRKFPEKVMTMEKLVSLKSITEEAADFLGTLVKAGYNIFISGGTGSGKTTFLNALSGYIRPDERVITIEDSAELQIRNIPNLVRLETRSKNSEGRNEITIRDLIKASLRMRPDRLVVGEVRDEAAVDMLQALNTGHSGMSTGHANSTRDILSRLETMVLLGADIPLPAVRRQIASAIDIVVQLSRMRDRSRRVVEISEVTGYENGEITLAPLYVFKETGEEGGVIVGSLEKTENRLTRRSKLESAGLQPAEA